MPVSALPRPALSAFVAGLLLVAALPSAAQRLDPGFGSDGLVVLDPGEVDTSFFAVEEPAFDGGGGILVLLGGERDIDSSGLSVLGKLDDSGAPMGGFASAGFRVLAAGAPFARQLERRDDGRIWVLTLERFDSGGGEADHGVLYRFSDSGASDTSFDFDGRRVLFELGSGGDATIAPAADGGIFALPAIDVSGAPSRVIKLTASGAPDSGFAGGELALALPAGGSGLPLGVRAVELDDGSLLVQGLAVEALSMPGQSIQCVLWRFTAAGLPFPGFGVDGAVRFDMIPGVPNSLCIYLALDGEAVIVAGQTGENADPEQDSVNGALARVMLADGSLDPGFGTGGRVATPADPLAYDAISSVAVDVAARRIVVAHQGENSPDDLLGRYDADTGQPDTSLGVDGRTPLLLDFGTGPENAWLGRVAIDPEGRTLVTGANNTGGSYYPWLVRLAGPDIFANGFED